MRTGRIIDIAEIFLGIVCAVYYVICVYASGAGVSVLFVWPVMGGLLILKGALGVFLRKKCSKFLKAFFMAFDIIFAAFLLSASTFSAFVIHDMNDIPKKNCEYVIVLGAGVDGTKPSGVLQKRIDAAYEYLLENNNTKAVGTGGQGKGEDISEGYCIASELFKMGIQEERLLYEDKSATTVENFKFALEKIDDLPESIAVVSNGFHIFRSKMILRNYTKSEVYGLSAGGGGVLIPHYILREYIVFITDIVMGNYSIVF